MNMTINVSAPGSCPCNGCKDRVAEPNCHTNCEGYNRWKNELAEMNRKRQAEQQANCISDSFVRYMRKKANKNRNRR